MRFPAVFLLVWAVIGAGCGKTVYQSSEGARCSVSDDDDPYHECHRSTDLVCINTYAQPFAVNGTAVSQPIWLCRLACDPMQGASACRMGDVCCPGPIHGRTYGLTHACVPPARCEAVPPPGSGDAGSADGTSADASASN